MKTIALATVAALAALSTAPAYAHGRVSVGIGFGVPLYGPYWNPWWYPPPYYYPQPAVVIPSQPVTYIEQGANQPVDQTGWWYYCDASRGYYPYVKECPSGWQRVPPVPPSAK